MWRRSAVAAGLRCNRCSISVRRARSMEKPPRCKALSQNGLRRRAGIGRPHHENFNHFGNFFPIQAGAVHWKGERKNGRSYSCWQQTVSEIPASQNVWHIRAIAGKEHAAERLSPKHAIKQVERLLSNPGLSMERISEC